jgi:hypothetical protein
MSYRDIQKSRAYSAQWRKDHREEHLTYNRAYRASHKEEARLRQQAYRDAGRDLTPSIRFSRVKSMAPQRGKDFDLTFDQYLQLVHSGACHYCGGVLPPTGGGLDRKDSSQGYTYDNCVPCCSACNGIRGKDIVSYAEMLEVAKLLNRLRGIVR